MQEELQRLKQQFRVGFVAFLAINALVAAALYHYFYTPILARSQGFISQLTFLIALYFFVSSAFALQFAQKFFALRYKHFAITPLLKKFFQETHYAPGAGASAQEIRSSELFGHFDKIDSSDRFSARHQDTRFTVCNLRLYVIDRDVEREKTYVKKTFDGLFIHFTFNRPFESTVVIKEARWVKILSTQPFFGKRLEKIKVIAPEFSKRYEAWGDDQVLSRKILKPELLEKIILLSQSFSMTLTMHENNVYMNIAKQRLKFDPRLFLLPSRSEEERERRITTSLKLLKDIIDALKLEQRLTRS